MQFIFRSARSLPLSLLLGLALFGPRAVAAPDLPSHLPAGYPGRPETGQPQAIPGVIHAINYDRAPDDRNGVTFSYQGKPVTSDFRTGADSVGIGTFGDDHVNLKGQPEKPGQAYLGWTQPHEWWKYTVAVAESGTYKIGGKFAAGAKDATLTFSFGPNLTTGPVTIPTTAGYQSAHEVYHVWETLDDLAEIKLEAGLYVMTVEMGETAQLNLENFSFEKK